MRLILLVLTLAAHAQAPDQKLDLAPHADYTAPPPDKVDLRKPVTTRERIVKINGIEYRQIEYKGEYFTVKGREGDNYNDCSRTVETQDSFAADASVKVGRRTALFIESLRQHCSENDHMVHTSPDIRDSNIGVKWKTQGPNPSEKAILVNP